MIHTKKIIYKPISDLNKSFPPGFQSIYFRMLPKIVKFQIISKKIPQMEKNNFTDICTLLNFTLDDINDEKQLLEEYLTSLKFILKSKKSKNTRRRVNKITQKEIDNLTLRSTLFTQNLEKEYLRIFPLQIEFIRKKYNLKEHNSILKESKKIIFNLQTVMEVDVKKLNDERKELTLKNFEETNPALSQERQATIKKLREYIINYVDSVYTPIIEKYSKIVCDSNTKLEHFFFTVVDSINQKIEKVKNRSSLDTTEFYFTDNFELKIMVRNKSPNKFPFKVLHFEDLDTTQKKQIIQILKCEVRK